MQIQIGNEKEQTAEISRPRDTEIEQPIREKEISIDQQSDHQPETEKSVPRQRRAEVQNPLMHESY